jgi:hypothetical protein
MIPGGMSDLAIPEFDVPESATCKQCGCPLHITTTASGVPYWASNSGNSRCIWPMQHMRHEAVLS